MSYVRFRTQSAFEDSLYTVLKKLEAPHNDPKNVGDGDITIGLGFNLNGGGRVVQDAVFGAQGLILETDPLFALGTAAQRAREQSCVDRLRSAISARNTSELHSIMGERAGDTLLEGWTTNRHASFKFHDRNGNGSTDDEIRGAFNELLLVYREKVTTQYGALVGAVDAQGTPYAGSREEMVLVSLAWNSPKLLGDGLGRALTVNGDRAEAWYEIRYNSNGGRTDNVKAGLAKRHYYESEIFGLYDSPSSVTLGEATQVYRTFTLHRNDIAAYEKTYGIAFDGTLGSRGNQIAAANNDYHLSGSDTVDYIHDALAPARTALFTDLMALYPTGMAGLNATDFNPVNILLDPGRDNVKDPPRANTHIAFLNSALDPVTDAEKNTKDILIGEGGDDYLLGGKGDDILIGGLGNDVYYYREGDGNDRIVEEREADGSIGARIYVIKGQSGSSDAQLVAGVFQKDPNQQNVWKSPDGTLTLTHDSPWRIVLPDGGEIDLGDTLSSGDFGIQLKDAPVAPTTTFTLTGDLEPLDGDPITADVQPVSDGFGNYVRDPNLPAPDRADVFYDSPDNDQVRSKGGDDWIEAWRGGDDRLDGGAGRDMVLAGAGRDLVIGGADADRLVGEGGDDVLHGGEEIAITAAYGIGAVQAGSGERGDWLDGRSGDDIAIGDVGDDSLFGGAGGDVLFGGGGADNLFGDRESIAIPFDWTITRTIDEQPGITYYDLAYSSGISIVESAVGGADSLYGGAGEDWIFAGNGDDYVDGGAEAYLAFGEADDCELGGDVSA